jgi:Xaa-Pro aminopeptidase
MTEAIAHAQIYAARRARLAAQLGNGGVAIIPTAPEHARNRDSDFAYRHDSYFYYPTLGSFSMPQGAVLCLASPKIWNAKFGTVTD